MPNPSQSEPSHREHFAKALAAWLAAFGLEDQPRLLSITRTFVAQDCGHGTSRQLLRLCEDIADRLDAAASANPALAESRRHLRATIKYFGPSTQTKDDHEVIVPLGNAPLTMAEDLLALLVTEGARDGVTVGQLEDAFREELLRDGWAELYLFLKYIAKDLTKMGEPQFDGVMTSVERGRDLFRAIGTPRPGGPMEAYRAELQAHRKRHPHPTQSGWTPFEPSVKISLPAHIAGSTQGST